MPKRPNDGMPSNEIQSDKTLTIDLSDNEKKILLGATLMHWGVPFHFAKKRSLSQKEQQTADSLSDRLIESRKDLSANSRVESSFGISKDEQYVILQILRTCLEECGENLVDLHLHLNANSRGDIELLIDKIQELDLDCPRLVTSA